MGVAGAVYARALRFVRIVVGAASRRRSGPRARGALVPAEAGPRCRARGRRQEQAPTIRSAERRWPFSGATARAAGAQAPPLGSRVFDLRLVTRDPRLIRSYWKAPPGPCGAAQYGDNAHASPSRNARASGGSAERGAAPQNCRRGHTRAGKRHAASPLGTKPWNGTEPRRARASATAAPRPRRPTRGPPPARQLGPQGPRPPGPSLRIFDPRLVTRDPRLILKLLGSPFRPLAGPGSTSDNSLSRPEQERPGPGWVG